MGVQQDLHDLGEKISKLKENPEQFRIALAVAMLAFGWVAIKMPLTARIVAKKQELVEAEALAARAERVMKLRASAELFDSRLDCPADPSDWQEYVYEIVAETGVAMPKQEASDGNLIYDLEKVILPIQITGTYSQIWNFVDTIERSSRLMRLESLNLSISEGILSLQCDLVGLARPGLGGVGDAVMPSANSESSSSPPPPEQTQDQEEDIA